MIRRALLLGLAALLASASPAAAADAVPPTASTAASAAVGQRITVSGKGWPAASVITVQLCGQEATHGSADCDLAGARSGGSTGAGVFSLELTVALPPRPCPCVVLVTSVATTRTVALPIDVAGAPVVPVVLPPERLNPPRIVVTGVHVRTRRTIAEWFGGRAHRTAVVSFTNSGFGTATNVRLTVLGGRGGKLTSEYGSTTLRSVVPRGNGTVEIPFTMGSFSLGKTQIRIKAGIGAGQSRAVGTTSVYPWGLLVVFLAVLQLGLLAVRNRLRRRLVGDAGDHDPEPYVELPEAAEPVAADLAALEEVIDLRPRPLVMPPRTVAAAAALETSETERAAGRSSLLEHLRHRGHANGTEAAALELRALIAEQSRASAAMADMVRETKELLEVATQLVAALDAARPEPPAPARRWFRRS